MARKSAFYGLMLAAALVFSYAEAVIPINIAVPGVKLGLANIAILTVLYTKGFKPALTINILRIIIVGLSFGNFASFILSLTGGIVATTFMILFKKLGFSIVSVSAAAAVAHNVGQIIAARFVIGAPLVVYYLPILVLTGIVTGILTGICSNICIKTIKKHKLF